MRLDLRRCAGWWVLFFLMYCGSRTLVDSIFNTPAPWPVTLPIAAFYSTWCALGAAWSERLLNPVRLRFWRDEEPHLLKIRCAETGRVLLAVAGKTLAGAELRSAALVGANLQGTDLRKADLRGAALAGATLQYADLRNADLEGANLSRADLVGALLYEANLRGADLRGADFRGSGLGMVLTDGRLAGADLTGALYDDTTRWPPFFDACARWCVYCERTAEDAARAVLPLPGHTMGAEGSLPLPSDEPASLRAGTQAGDRSGPT